MKKYILLLGVLLFTFLTQTQAQNALEEKLGDVMLKSETPTSFNYQALLYNNGTPVADQSVKVKIKLQDEGGRVYFEEEHATTTAKTGMINVMVGKGTKIAGTLNDIAWEKGVFIAAEANSGDGYKVLGPATKLQAVPYALYARAVPVIRGTKAGKEEGRPIFQVQSSKGEPLFSVYEEGISINVPDVPSNFRRPRGGFAVKSFRLGADFSESNSSDRLQVADGGVNINVDPVMRGYYGGFAVRTMSNLRGAQEDSKTLFSLDNRSMFFTLACQSIGTTFQFRDRCNENKVVMNLTDQGKIQSVQPTSQVLQNLLQVGSDYKLEVAWPWPDASATATQKLGFTNLMRWRKPKVKAVLEAASISKDVDFYEIVVQNDPSDSRKLTDYLKVGYYKEARNASPTLGVMLDSKLKLDENFVFPKGKIVVRTVAANPQLDSMIPFTDQKMLYADKFQFELQPYSETSINYFSINDTEFQMSLQKIEYTDNAVLQELVLNYPLQVEILSEEFKDCLKVTLADGRLKFTVTDQAAYKSAVGSLPGGGGFNRLIMKVKISFPNNIYEDVEGKGVFNVGE